MRRSTTASRTNTALQKPVLLRLVAVILLALAVLVLAARQPSRAVDVEVGGRPVTRTVLALYDGKQEGLPHLTRLHKLAEMPMNHLGFMLEYRDVNAPLPTVEELSRYRGVVTWFVEPLADPAAYIRWLEPAVASGLRYVMLGEIAPRESDELMRPINRVLAPLGLQHGGTFVDLTYKSKVAALDASMVGFEQKLDKALPGFPLMLQTSNELEAHLTIDAMTPEGPRKAVVIATGPRGGFASQNFTVILEPNTDRLSWVLNPFLFFAKSLATERFPIPDVTTVSGRRIYFSQIDGDGWNNLSDVEGYRQVLSSEVVARELIEPFPDLPVSIGLIAADVQPAGW
jgi:polysaccharide biosynthesis protein PelA